MRRIRRACLFVLCAVAVVLCRLGLWTLRYQTLRRLLVRACTDNPQPARGRAVFNVMRVVARVARRIPDASCLTQSIAAQAVLSWRGIPTTIAMGVRKDADETVHWHAWVMWNGLVVSQGDQRAPQEYTTLITLLTPTRQEPVAS